MEFFKDQDQKTDLAKRIANFLINKKRGENTDLNEVELPDSRLLKSFEISSEQNKTLPINIYKIYNYPEINEFWEDKLRDFYNDLSYDSKVARFNTAFNNIEDLSGAQKQSLLGADGKTVSLVAVDPIDNKIVAHAQRYIVKNQRKGFRRLL
jgi:hypothetical protein